MPAETEAGCLVENTQASRKSIICTDCRHAVRSGARTRTSLSLVGKAPQLDPPSQVRLGRISPRPGCVVETGDCRKREGILRIGDKMNAIQKGTVVSMNLAKHSRGAKNECGRRVRAGKESMSE